MPIHQPCRKMHTLIKYDYILAIYYIRKGQSVIYFTYKVYASTYVINGLMVRRNHEKCIHNHLLLCMHTLCIRLKIYKVYA